MKGKTAMSTIQMVLFTAGVYSVGVATLAAWCWLDRRRERSEEPQTVVYVPQGFDFLPLYPEPLPPAVLPAWVDEDSIARTFEPQAEPLWVPPQPRPPDEIDRMADEICRDPVRLNRMLEAVYAYEPDPGEVPDD